MTHTLTITNTQANRIAKKLTTAMSKEQTRYYLCGVFLESKGGELHAVATDGHVLGRLKLDIADQKLEEFGVILPPEAVAFLGKAPVTRSEQWHTVTIEIAEDKVTIALQSGLSGTFKLVDGTFPDYRRVISAHENATVVGIAPRLIEKLGKMAYGSEAVKIEVKDANSPVVCTQGEDFTAVVMPWLKRLLGIECMHEWVYSRDQITLNITRRQCIKCLKKER